MPERETKYSPRPMAERSGVGLCLSGGGYRAALFHLGALRRLNELGILGKVTTISSVSGGSILSAHLAARLTPWPAAPLPAQEWETRIAAPFRAFASRNLRTGPIMRRLLPWNWLRDSTGVEGLASRYERDLTDLTLASLPEAPRFVYCATDMAYGVNWIFERRRMGDYQVGYIPPPAEWKLARAVAASSCFPPVFNPLPIREAPSAFTGGKAEPGPKRDECLSDLRLTDGGNYDNMGLEPVWKDHETVLVSDGGASFAFRSDKSLVWRLWRYMEIQANQSAALRRRWLIAGFIRGDFSGTYWGIASSTASYPTASLQGYEDAFVKERIASIRTDLDAFSDAEAAVLENHGYLVCSAAVQSHASQLAATAAPPAIPHPEWVDVARAGPALAESNRRKLPFGRGWP